MLKDKVILLGVTGGIAAYKAADLASRLTKEILLHPEIGCNRMGLSYCFRSPDAIG